MRIETTQRKRYTFAELPDDIQQKALANLWDINVHDSFWQEFVLNDAKALGALIGIDIDKIYFSGFSSQGDGACFVGRYSYKKGAVEAVKEYAPNEEILHSIAQELQDVQKRHFYGLNASVVHRGPYSHEYCTDIRVDYDAPNYQDMAITAEADISNGLRNFMRWTYAKLASAYNYATLDKSIIATIEANEYEFTEQGKLA